MGNQPSAPQGSPPVAPMAPPPVCDANCQRQKLLSGLKTTLDEKEQTKAQDPEGYQQARIAYYTALNGDEWLVKEKERIAKDEISPKITAYTTQYDELKKQQSSQKVFVNLMNSLQAQQAEDEQDLDYLKKQLQSEKDKADVLNRLTVLDTAPVPSTNYTPILLDVVLAVLGLIVLYLGYKKFPAIKSYFVSTPAVTTGGKRLPH
jgi:hypothetical protein